MSEIADRSARIAERIAMAILNGDVAAEQRDDAFVQLRMHTRIKEVERDAEALRRYRAGEPVWTWPATAPWAGF